MARIRSVKPEFWTDEDLADVSRDARLLYIGLWNLADEHGRLRGDPRYVKGQLFPYDDDLPAAVVEELLKALEAAGKVLRYRADDRQYLFLPNLHKHQRLEGDKVPSKLPPPTDADTSAPRADKSEPRADKSARDNDEVTHGADQGERAAQVRADKSAPDADKSSLLYVAGSMEQGAGSMLGASAPRADKPRDLPSAEVDFDRFWATYPRKEAKGQARKAWNTAIKKANAETIIAGAERYHDRPGRDPAYTAHPSTWLNGERWNDEPPATGSFTADSYRAPLPPSSAPTAIPANERCPAHRGEIKGQCRHCHAIAIGRPRGN